MSLERLKSLEDLFVIEVKSRVETPDRLMWKITITPRAGGAAIEAEHSDMTEAARQVLRRAEHDGRIDHDGR